MSQFQVVVTGSIASGKSLACQYFKDWGIEVIDADQVSRELVMPNSPIFNQIIARFGSGVIQTSGALDRAALSRIVFSLPAERVWLESILHPKIVQVMNNKARQAKSAYVMLAIPLLTDLERYPCVKRVLWLNADLNTRLKRALTRPGMTEQQFHQIEQAHPSDEARSRLADDIIINNDSASAFKQSILELHNQYLKLCQSSGS